jgi:hypothetical protein
MNVVAEEVKINECKCIRNGAHFDNMDHVVKALVNLNQRLANSEQNPPRLAAASFT